MGLDQYPSRLATASRPVADRLSSEARSALMSRIKSQDTKPEMAVRRLLHGMGYRYVLHDRRLPGRPDLVFPARRKVIFIHGCFWHGHWCGRGFRPKKNADFWAAKIDGNAARDAHQLEALRAQRWRSLVVWECEARPGDMEGLAARLVDFLEA